MNKNDKLEITIEIPKDSPVKYEYDRKTGKIIVDRVLFGDFRYPANYGFIPHTLDWDGDELDVLVYSPHQFFPGVNARVRIVGAMKMIDDGETDTKLIGVHADDVALADINTLTELPTAWLDKVKTFFSTYKNYKRPGITKVSGFEDAEWAMHELTECRELMTWYGHLPKDEFINLMKKKRPDKYTI